MNKARTCLWTIILLVIALSECTTPSQAQLSTSRLFADHMVLQRNQKINVWGWCKNAAKVTVSLNGHQANTVADAKGNWKATLPPMHAGGPYIMDVTSGKEHLQYKDVMLGEVWICSGQSNMQFFLNQATGYEQEQKQADTIAVRQFLVPQKMSLTPEKNLSSGEWFKASADKVGYFSAVGYYFAKQLSQKLHVTVGIVHSSWGASQAECWISKEGLLRSPDLSTVVKQQPDNWPAIKKLAEADIKAYAYQNQPVKTYNIAQLVQESPAFFNNWPTGTLGPWQWQANWYAYRGTGFMQRSMVLYDDLVNAPSALKLGDTDANVDLYINGKSIFKGTLPKGKIIDLPTGTWKIGENNMVLQLLSDQKNPWWFGFGLNGDAANTYIKFATTTMPLADYKWHLMPDFSKPYHVEPTTNQTVFTVYNAMVNPLIPLSVAGVAWYQGESNAARASQYRTVLPLLINDWRSKWKTNLPFMIVQLPAFGPFQNSNQGSTWAELREAQTMALKLPNTALAVTYDVGNPQNLHPTNKAPVGVRLADAALNKVYHISNADASPIYQSANFSDGAAVVSFTDAEKGLTTKNGNAPKGFELAGADHKFYPAQAQIIGDKVKVWCSQVKEPIAVRYAWSDSPITANLFSKAGLPVSPFRSDHFAGITDGKKLQLFK